MADFASPQKIPTLRLVTYILLGYAALCLITAFVLDSDTGFKETVSITDPARGETVGPISVTDDHTVVEISLRQPVPMNNWAFVQGELLDAEKTYLMGFGDEMWAETGYDSDGRWTEVEDEYSTKLTIPEPGDYYFRFVTSESSTAPTRLQSTRIVIQEKMASALPHFTLGIIAFVFGAVLYWISSNKGR